MAMDLVIVWQTVNLTRSQTYKQVVIVLNTVLISRCFWTLSIKIPSAYQTPVNVVVSKRNATYFLKVKVQQMTTNRTQIRTVVI